MRSEDAIRIRSAFIRVAWASLLTGLTISAIAWTFRDPRLVQVAALALLVASASAIGLWILPRAERLGTLSPILVALAAAVAVLAPFPSALAASLLGALAIMVFGLGLKDHLTRHVTWIGGITAGILALLIAGPRLKADTVPWHEAAPSAVVTTSTFLIAAYLLWDVRRVMDRRASALAEAKIRQTKVDERNRAQDRLIRQRAETLARIRHDALPALRAARRLAEGAAWPTHARQATFERALSQLEDRVTDAENIDEVVVVKELFDVRDVVEGAAGIGMQPEGRLIVDAPEIAVISDRRSLEKVILNLVSNAARYAETTVHVRVTVAETLHIEVRDDGPGIAHPDQMFTAGTQGDRPGSAGLGLAIVRELIDAVGAHIHVANDDGAVFTVQWPIERAPRAQVLVLDDDLLMRELTVELLHEIGIPALAVPTIRAATRVDATIALVDHHLREGTGRDALAVLDMPCFLYSGSDAIDATGFVGSLEKPLTPAGLAIVRTYLQALPNTEPVSIRPAIPGPVYADN